MFEIFKKWFGKKEKKTEEEPVRFTPLTADDSTSGITPPETRYTEDYAQFVERTDAQASVSRDGGLAEQMLNDPFADVAAQDEDVEIPAFATHREKPVSVVVQQNPGAPVQEEKPAAEEAPAEEPVTEEVPAEEPAVEEVLPEEPVITETLPEEEPQAEPEIIEEVPAEETQAEPEAEEEPEFAVEEPAEEEEPEFAVEEIPEEEPVAAEEAEAKEEPEPAEEEKLPTEEEILEEPFADLAAQDEDKN